MKFQCTTVIAVIVYLTATVTCHAKRAAVEPETVSVTELVRTIEAELKEAPINPDLLFELARVHAAAYASKSDKIEVRPGRTTPWFGLLKKGIPYKVKHSDDKETLAVAKAHLVRSLELHVKVVTLKPDHYLARIGLAWCTEESGKKQEAIALYRKLIEETLPLDRKIESLWDGEATISTEASNRLIALLEDDIKTLKKQSEKTENRIRRLM